MHDRGRFSYRILPFAGCWGGWRCRVGGRGPSSWSYSDCRSWCRGGVIHPSCVRTEPELCLANGTGGWKPLQDVHLTTLRGISAHSGKGNISDQMEERFLPQVLFWGRKAERVRRCRFYWKHRWTHGSSGRTPVMLTGASSGAVLLEKKSW